MVGPAAGNHGFKIFAAISGQEDEMDLLDRAKLFLGMT
jgi:hypothetical protein